MSNHNNFRWQELPSRCRYKVSHEGEHLFEFHLLIAMVTNIRFHGCMYSENLADGWFAQRILCAYIEFTMQPYLSMLYRSYWNHLSHMFYIKQATLNKLSIWFYFCVFLHSVAIMARRGRNSIHSYFEYSIHWYRGFVSICNRKNFF